MRVEYQKQCGLQVHMVLWVTKDEQKSHPSERRDLRRNATNQAGRRDRSSVQRDL